MPPKEQVSALEEGRVDIGFGITVGVEDKDVQVSELFEGCWLVVLPRAHRLAQLETVPLAELAGERLVLFSRALNPVLYDTLLSHCRAAGLVPEIVYETSQAQSGPNLVRGGLGLWIVASYGASDLPDELVSRPLPELDAPIIAAFTRRGESSPVVRRLLEEVKGLQTT